MKRVSVAVFTLIVLSSLHAGVIRSASAQRNVTRTTVPNVIVDARVELISIIFRLAGNPEYSQGKVDQYTQDVETHFGRFRNHPVVQLAKELRRTRGVSYDACMGMAVHMVDGYSLAEKVPFSPLPATLDKRWTTDTARDFLAKAGRFVEETSFKRFFESHQQLYDTAVSRMQQVLAEHAHLEWFDAFFGERPQASFTVQLGMLNGGACYGARSVNRSGSIDLFCVLGVWKTDSNGVPAFDASMLSTVVHEFCHSYTNPIVDKHEAKLQPAGEKIFPHVEAAMRRQAYGTWKTMMYESFVRACVVRYMHQYSGRQVATAEIQRQTERGFAWVGDLARLLEQYEANRSEYPDLDAFVPRIAAFFNEYADSFSRSQLQMASKRPRILSMTPANGATNVSPKLRAIRVVFDRPMQDGNWSLVGSGPHFPKVAGKPAYDKKCMVWTVPIQLKPSWSYQFMLNSSRFQSFRSRDGVALEPVQVSFKTGSGSR